VLAGLDVGVLFAPGRSASPIAVEDLVLETIVAIADLSENDVRQTLLTCLRTAGRTDLEMRVLIAFGSGEDIEQTLCGLEAEGIPLSEEDDRALTARKQAITHQDGNQTDLPQA